LHRNRACSGSGIPEICRNPDPDLKLGLTPRTSVEYEPVAEVVEYGDNDFGQLAGVPKYYIPVRTTSS